ncbi:MAG: M23 family peptidase, partial [Sporichthya sp.]|nr:M23 family peptidase [Sporichthya sp.]
MFLNLTAALALAAGLPAPADPGEDWRAPVGGPVRVIRPFLAPPGPYAPGHRGA